MMVDIVLKFNSRAAGGGQVLRRRFDRDDAVSLYVLIDEVVTEATRMPEHGQSIYVTGFSVETV